MRRKLLCVAVVLALCSCFTKFMTWQHNHRDAVIVHVPIEAFNDEGKLIDEKWTSYLRKHRPVGVIFFPEHFKKRDVSIKIITEIKKILGEQTFFAVDEEGGMIQRIPWMDIPSAMEVASKYSELKLKKGIIDAKQYVRDIYAPMFKEMKELGLNMDFAPNLDISFLNADVNKHYAKAVEYMSITRIQIWIFLSTTAMLTRIMLRLRSICQYRGYHQRKYHFGRSHCITRVRCLSPT